MAMTVANFTALIDAYILGTISPKSNISAVTTMTWRKNAIKGNSSSLISLLVTNTDKTTIATLIKLLEIKIVARSLLGLPSNRRMSLLRRLWDSSISLSWDGLSEKKATSEPDIIAEKNNNITMAAKLRIKEVLSGSSTFYF